MFKKTVLIAAAALLVQAQAGDPLKAVREKNFYKTGEAAKNTNFIEWLKKPVFGESSSSVAEGNVSSDGNAGGSGSSFFGLLNSRPIKTNAALQAIRDEKYKEKEARMRAKWEAERAERAAKEQQER